MMVEIFQIIRKKGEALTDKWHCISIFSSQKVRAVVTLATITASLAHQFRHRSPP